LHSNAISDSVPVVRPTVDESTPDVDTNQDNTPENVDYPFINFTNESDHKTLKDEQKADTTLDPLWRMTSQNNGHIFVKNGILYHREEVGGHEVKQLCVPHGRRLQVMRLAHDTVVSGQLGKQKTSERIRVSFFWPNMKRDILSYTSSFQPTQLRARAKRTDKVHVTPIVLPIVPFVMFHADIINPLQPKCAYMR